MATILSLEKELFTPTKEDLSEAARYLGYQKVTPPDENIAELIEKCCLEMLEELTPKAVFEVFPLSLSSDTKEISFADVHMVSNALSVNLKDCHTVYLFAATIGPKVDALIRKTQKLDTVKASIFQAAGAMYVEKVVDYVNQEIKKITASQEQSCKPRFSPGYGDVSLEVQKDFFRLLPCSKIGLTLMDTLVMAPEKSVTAFIGVL